MTLLGLKLSLLLVILASAWIGGFIPLRRSSMDSPRFLAWGDAFAAGIFLGIGLIHMLADASAAWKGALGWTYPMAPLLAGAAFLVLLRLEHVVIPAYLRAGEEASGRRARPAERAFYPYTLMVALSVHSFILGASMGVQDVRATVGLIFLAIVVHKSTAAFALGVSLARSPLPRRRSLGLIGLFAVMTPMGIIVGLLAADALANRGQTVFDAVFLALASGSFIYIAAFDIARDEFLRPGARGAKWLLAAAGYALTAALAIWL